MLECTFISKKFIPTLLLLLLAAPSFAQTGVPGNDIQVPPGAEQQANPENQPAIPPAVKPKSQDPGLFEPSSPYLEYGDFNLGDEEEMDTLYYQYGRFFGVSVGTGYESATGNRGKLYNSAFPRIDIKVHYWFDFQLALNFGIMMANHSYVYQNEDYKVALVGFLVDLKYYFNVKNMSAIWTFANPYLIAGVGALSKTESTLTKSVDTDSTFSVGGGAGLEFPIVHKSTYFLLEARYFTQSFRDSAETQFQSRGIEDLSGGFYTLMAHILFTW